MSGASSDNAPIPLADYDLTPPMRWFALDHHQKNNRIWGLRTGAGNFVARRYASSSYTDPGALDYEEQTLHALSRRALSFAIPLPLPTRNGALHVGDGAHRSALLPLFQGTPLAHQPLDGGILGAALGELQVALREQPAIPRPGRALFKDLFAFPAAQGASLHPTPGELGVPRTIESDALLRWWREETAQLQEFVERGYHQLPRQRCHNDVTPNNVLAAADRATAVLDFEFATVAARALDFTTGLRQIIRHWIPGAAWTEVEPFCRGYARWTTLTERETTLLPELLCLRGAITVLWWLGSEHGGEKGGRVLDSIANLQRLTRWLGGNAPQLIDVVNRVLLP